MDGTAMTSVETVTNAVVEDVRKDMNCDKDVVSASNAVAKNDRKDEHQSDIEDGKDLDTASGADVDDVRGDEHQSTVDNDNGVDETDAKRLSFMKALERFACGTSMSKAAMGKATTGIQAMDDEVYEPEVYTLSPNITKDEMLSNVYKMDHPRRGKALIINNKQFARNMESEGFGVRTGTDVDATSISTRLRLLGFDVEKHTNVSSARLMNYLHETANENHADADCFVCVILSHGEEGVIIATDGRVEVNVILNPFKGNNCRSLAGKPKLFFIQACRGGQMDKGVSMNVTDAKAVSEMPNSDMQIRIPSEADFLVAYSTVPGFYSWRNSINGSWFMQALVSILDTFGTSSELLKIMTMVNRMVAFNFKSNTTLKSMHDMKQASSFTTTLTKELYFIPKAK